MERSTDVGLVGIYNDKMAIGTHTSLGKEERTACRAIATGMAFNVAKVAAQKAGRKGSEEFAGRVFNKSLCVCRRHHDDHFTFFSNLRWRINASRIVLLDLFCSQDYVEKMEFRLLLQYTRVYFELYQLFSGMEKVRFGLRSCAIFRQAKH